MCVCVCVHACVCVCVCLFVYVCVCMCVILLRIVCVMNLILIFLCHLFNIQEREPYLCDIKKQTFNIGLYSDIYSPVSLNLL